MIVVLTETDQGTVAFVGLCRADLGQMIQGVPMPFIEFRELQVALELVPSGVISIQMLYGNTDDDLHRQVREIMGDIMPGTTTEIIDTDGQVYQPDPNGPTSTGRRNPRLN